MDAPSRPLVQLATWVRARFGPRLVSLKLFGSWARGEAHEESDVDVLVVVTELTGAEAKEIAHFCGDLLTEHDVVGGAGDRRESR